MSFYEHALLMLNEKLQNLEVDVGSDSVEAIPSGMDTWNEK